jgi:hypothetical protein
VTIDATSLRADQDQRWTPEEWAAPQDGDVAAGLEAGTDNAAS